MKSIQDPRHNARRLALSALFCTLFHPGDINSEDIINTSKMNTGAIDSGAKSSETPKEMSVSKDAAPIKFSEENKDRCIFLANELLELEATETDLTQRLIDGIYEHLSDIDGIIEQCAPEWPVNKIAKVDLIILRMAVFEILYDNEVPDKVVIDEAVELAKEFGNDTSSKFVNGVLGTVIEVKES